MEKSIADILADVVRSLIELVKSQQKTIDEQSTLIETLRTKVTKLENALEDAYR